ncbi:MAG: sugar transferase [Candidatus Cohnella colombiensis]|uniref:Sugar transferase n=1 Tax=Candidatus Cohnella colombiensis TaxID=3121368 RepID=A0AA95JAG0_9BACL|nr:MAG: sugar transferase [Cohnella sp.]
MKRLIDITIALLVLLLLLPAWLVIALLIKWTSSGPVLFMQDRPGRGTKVFGVYKFRTMKLGSETMIKGHEVMKDDDRVTSIGKLLRRTKLDEIPQMLNVLKGEMSLIGPRPERIDYLPEYTAEELKRFNVRPGLTGLAQVSGGIYISLDERHRYDVYYVDHYSLWLDIKIVVRTIGVILFGEEKYMNRELVSFKKIEKSSEKEQLLNRQY